MVPTPKWDNTEQPRIHITRFTIVPNLGPIHGGFVIFSTFPLFSSENPSVETLPFALVYLQARTVADLL
jgi:hypothetical protein